MKNPAYSTQWLPTSGRRMGTTDLVPEYSAFSAKTSQPNRHITVYARKQGFTQPIFFRTPFYHRRSRGAYNITLYWSAIYHKSLRAMLHCVALSVATQSSRKRETSMRRLSAMCRPRLKSFCCCCCFLFFGNKTRDFTIGSGPVHCSEITWPFRLSFHRAPDYFDELVQERRNSIANALKLRLSCTNPRFTPWLLSDLIICGAPIH